MTDFPIGGLARQTNVKVQTIRYYEEIGLLPEPVRTSSNRRLYGAGDVARPTFIRHARELGFSIDDIRSLLDLQDHPERPCAAADEIAKERLKDVESRLARLSLLKTELQRMVTQCNGGKVASCHVIEVLSDHSLCASASHDRSTRQGLSKQ